MSTKNKSAQGEAIRWIVDNWLQIALLLLLLLAFGLRMIDLTDAPLDFHPTRQFRGALIARSLYFELAPSADPQIQAQMLALHDSVAKLEPPIVEGIVAFIYFLLGSVHLWIARIVNSIFWLLGGFALFALARRAISAKAALLALAYYFFLPFSVIASRSFQPDPFMVTLIAIAAFAAYRWSEERTWKWTLITGATAGLAILVKAVAAYFLGGMLLAVVLHELGIKRSLRDAQVWGIFTLSLLPAAIYYIFGIAGRSGDYVQNWIVALLPLAFEPGFYVSWLSFIGSTFGLTVILLALSAVLFARGIYRWMLIGLWAGYLLYGITLPHQTLTHNYYHLPLLLILALSLAPFCQLLVQEISKREKIWQSTFTLLLLGALAFNALLSRNMLVAEDQRNEAAYWETVGEALPVDGRIVGLVQHYGNLLNYYGSRNIALWPVTSELNLAELRGNDSSDFETVFRERTETADYFLVTTFNQLEQQTQLSERLYTQYPIWAEGDGYIIFDLRDSSLGTQ